MEVASQTRTFVAPIWSVHTPRRLSRRRSLLCGAETREPVSRRTAALLLGGLPTLAVPAARALLPAEDEDDEQLVDLAKSRRKERLAEERKVERSFVRNADYNGADVISVQNAVNRLAKEGLSLETGDLKSLASSSKEWVADFKKAIGDLSGSPAAQKSSQQVFSSLDELNQSIKGGDVEAAKSNFASAVSAMQGWVSDAGLTNQIKGL